MTEKTITVTIRNRWNDEPIYTTEIPGDTPSGMQTRVALERAVSDRADLGDANLCDANLCDANLGGANLGGANLGDVVNLWDTTGDRRHIKSLQIETWGVTYTATHMQIGCQLHTLERWWGFSDEQISKMDYQALEWWGRWKPVLQQIIAMSPADPGGEKPFEEAAAPVEATE
ncbi:pentapeptide repeat-containing protein [Castellaniella denitrificans]|uniref:Pentapeptide repeat-containing protein n=1 Tax=Castellaniella denitrificans TaxID=56119 RepID=A0ABT4M603_9BURK|nr:pentapeptide repeat-containing protein [Castellaniella denitrificans]MCZ4330747.1 pentapeptide repeat-containing protein [Castellaniella denitrificans]